MRLIGDTSLFIYRTISVDSVHKLNKVPVYVISIDSIPFTGINLTHPSSLIVMIADNKQIVNGTRLQYNHDRY
jgi:hypothetical protein